MDQCNLCMLRGIYLVVLCLGGGQLSKSSRMVYWQRKSVVKRPSRGIAPRGQNITRLGDLNIIRMQ